MTELYNPHMATTPASTAFDRAVNPLLQALLPDRIGAVLDFRPDPALQSRIEQLAGKANEGELSDNELAEYQGYIRANKFVAILQRQARRLASIRDE